MPQGSHSPEPRSWDMGQGGWPSVPSLSGSPSCPGTESRPWGTQALGSQPDRPHQVPQLHGEQGHAHSCSLEGRLWNHWKGVASCTFSCPGQGVSSEVLPTRWLWKETLNLRVGKKAIIP